MTLEELLEINPYSLGKEDKHAVLDEYLLNLSKYHYEHSEEYKKMLDSTGVDLNKIQHYEDLPYLPVSLFKDLTLRSVAEDEVIKTMTSSGTTGQKTSKIYLDRETSANQTKTLTKIVASLLGNKRVPMIILDSSNVVKDRNMFSARGAGILGFSMFGSKRMYALDDNMELDIEGMKAFLEEHKDETIFLFGFTFMIWQHFYKKLLESGYKPDLSKGVLIHGGGWKKLVAESVSTAQFKQCLNDVCGIKVENVHDYYGMVEQTGTIYIECECGHLHASNFSDIIIRNPKDFSVAKNGEIGIIEDLDAMTKETQEILRRQLRLSYFTPVIEKIYSIKDEYGFAYFHVMTDKGECKFAINMGSNAFSKLSDTRLIISDVDENRFEIRDVDKLSHKERRMLDLFL